MKRSEQVLTNILKKKKLTIAFAESVTCGLATHKIGNTSNTSNVLMGSIICYHKKVKIDVLGVNRQLLKKYTAESQQVTDALATQLHKIIKADICAAITGLASSGGSESKNKPVGTVFYAVTIKGKLYRDKKIFKGSPLTIKKKACAYWYAFITQQIERINTNPHIIHIELKRNKHFPNSKHPVLIYKEAFTLPKQKNKASEIIQTIFIRNGWSNTWRNGIYDFHHYHSITHECMGIAMGTANVVIGGPNGKKIELSQGDLIILPAGVGHKCTRANKDFLCVGAYPQGKDYDINYGIATELEKALKHIHKLPIPAKDPVLGKQGFLKVFWK